MSLTSSYERLLILALILLFTLCATFVIKHRLNEGDALDYYDTARAKREIDQSYVLLIADSEQNSVRENAVKDQNKVDSPLDM